MRLLLTLGALLLVAGGLAVVLAGDSTGDAFEVEVGSVHDPSSSGLVTRIELNVTNHHDEPLEPWFTVPNNRLMNRNAWTIEEGPATLAPNETAHYTITQPPWTGIPRGRSFQVTALDRDSQLRGPSSFVEAKPPEPAPSVRNPDFRSWQPSMFAADELPFGWVPQTVLHEGDEFEVDGREGQLTLELDPNTNRAGPTEGPQAWSMVSLRQRIDFPKTFHVSFANGTRSDFALGPQTIAGVLLQDSYAGHQVVVLFADHPTAGDQPSQGLLELGEGFESQRYLVTNRSISLDLAEVWQENGWRIPESRYVPDPFPEGSRQIGFGGTSVAQAYAQFQPMRPIEMKMLVASFPPHERSHVEATFDYVGGPALDGGS